jgi:hypothetical protein
LSASVRNLEHAAWVWKKATVTINVMNDIT